MHLYFHAQKIQLIVSAHNNERPLFDAFFSEMMANVAMFSDQSILNQGHVLGMNWIYYYTLFVIALIIDLGFELNGFSSKKWNKLISIVQDQSEGQGGENKMIPLNPTEGSLESQPKLILFDFGLRPDGTVSLDLKTG